MCRLLGYQLTVVSEVGVGSTFSVLLDPAATAPAPTMQREEHPAS